ncbi:MAG TPA: hypothetical protein VHN19_17465 [Burkholderiales bacterium]|jgi:hypothetical protein|nr:hypothetical protein [Burkholderiales bacterium]
MKANTSQPIRIDPEVVAVLQARARRARSQAMHNLIGQLIHKLTPRLSLRRLGEHWG